MNQHHRILRFAAALLFVAIALGWMPIIETASADTPAVKVIKIAAGQNNSIALKSDGTVIVWGDQAATWAKPPEGLTGVVDIYAKDTTFMARKSNGTVVAWGSNNVGEANIPAGLGNVLSMASAGSHTLVVSETSLISGAGKVIGWGLNADGQSVVPTDAQAGVAQVAAGSYYSMALKFNGTVVDWGSNGTGATSKPENLNNVVAVDAGYLYALALKRDGTVVAWGKESNGNRILDVAGLTGVKAISANRTHALALKNDGTVVGWGDHTQPPAGLADVVAVSAGVDHSLALKSDGTVVSWGSQTSVPGDNELSSLTLEEGAPTPAFPSSVDSYHYDIDPEATSVHIEANLKDTAYSALYINDRLQTSGRTVAVSVPPTGAVIKVRVEPYMKAPKIYTLTVSRDRVPPSVTFSPNGSTAPLRTITTAVQVADATSGIDASTLEYAWSPTDSAPAGGWAGFSLLPHTQLAPFTYAGADGNWYLHIRARDYAENGATAVSEPFLIDNTAPTLDLKMKKGTIDGDDYNEADWSNMDVVITAEATDALSSPVTVKYTLDGGKTWTDYSGSITISEPGIHTVIVQASDAANNVQTDSRTVSITKDDLKLTITKTTVDGPYSSGEWVHNSVKVTAAAETKEGQTLTSFTWTWNGIDQGGYVGQEIFFPDDGMSSGEFKVTDSLGNSLTAPYAVNIDRKAPTVDFDPMGNATPAREASVTATVTDIGDSGLVESTLKYAWTQSTTELTDGWLPLKNGSTLTKAGADGSWYLHIQGKDAAGNEIDAASRVSPAFVLDNSALNSTLSPAAGSFDKNIAAQADVDTTLTLHGNTLVNISNGTDELLGGRDYAITGNTVIIRKSYLAAQPEGKTILTFTFSGGDTRTLEITISDTTPLNSEISPDIASFDKNISAQADVVTELALNGNTLSSISNGGTALVSGDDYIVDDDTVTILKRYLAAQPLGITSLTFTFSAGGIRTLILMIGDTMLSNSLIGPDAGHFDKKASAQADVVTTLMLNGNTLLGISNGGTALASGNDYTVDGDTVTILKRYLATRPIGTTDLTFTFSAGADQTLAIAVSDTTPSNTATDSTGGSSNPPAPSIDKGGVDIDPASIDLTKPSVTLETTPRDGAAYVSIPAGILTSFEGKNADFFIEIKSPYGSYQVPVNLASLIPGLQDLLATNDLKAEDISFKITLTDKSGDKDIRAAFEEGLPYGSAMGTIVDFSIQIVNAMNDEVIGTADQFSKALTRVIPMPKNVTDMPEQWGAFRYDEATKKFGFVPAKIVHIDHVWYVMVSSYTNSVYLVARNPVTFSDVRKHWSESRVGLAAAKGLVVGVGGGKYEPDRTITRAEFAAMLVRVLGYGRQTNGSLSYDDVKPNAWYYDAVTEAKALGLLHFASGNSFRPNQPLTREEMASMLAAAVTLEKLPMPQRQLDLDGYTDIKSVNAAYLEDVRMMVQLNIMRGTGMNRFSPKGEATRAQAAVVFIGTLQALGWIDS